MITPVDFRQKSFRTGIGYDKKDVDSFMVELLRNYEELYRSNAQQIAEIKDLSDNLIRYKAMEESLNRELMVAEKTSEEMVQEAADKAKKIEADAKAKAKKLLKTAKEDLAFTHQQTIQMAQMYASMKTQLNLFFKNFVDVTNSEDMSIDIDALEAFEAVTDDIKEAINASEVVPKMNFAASAYIPTMPMPGAKAQAAAFGSYDGDPQMRDESPLGGMSQDGAFTNSTVEGKYGDVSSAGFGFSSLSENEAYKDPFAGVDNKDTKKQEPEVTTKKTKKKVQPEDVNTSQYDEAAYAEDTDSVSDMTDAVEETYETYETVSETFDTSDTDMEDTYQEDIPTVDFEDTYTSDASEEEAEALEGDIEEKPAGTKLLGDGEETGQDFEFV